MRDLSLLSFCLHLCLCACERYDVSERSTAAHMDTGLAWFTAVTATLNVPSLSIYHGVRNKKPLYWARAAWTSEQVLCISFNFLCQVFLLRRANVETNVYQFGVNKRYKIYNIHFKKDALNWSKWINKIKNNEKQQSNNDKKKCFLSSKSAY